MKTLVFLAFRNFLRQKRRNILLGAAIAFGVMVLTVSFAFTAGLTDTILNRIVIYMAGHIQVTTIEQGRMMSPIVRDKDRMIETVKKNVEGISLIEESIGTYCRAIGNGKADYMFIVGLTMEAKFRDGFPLVAGNYADFENENIPNPILVSEEKAKALNVKVGDIVRLRLVNVNGQQETAALQVVAILKSQNVWMDYAGFTPLKSLKTMMAYQPQETGALRVLLKEPKTAVKKADLLYPKFIPNPAYISATMGTIPVTVAPLSTVTKGIVISGTMAKQLGKKVGDEMVFTYPTRFTNEQYTFKGKVESIDGPFSHVIGMSNDEFFKVYNFRIPKNETPLALDSESVKKVSTEWNLLPRTGTTQDYTKKMKNIMKDTHVQPIMDVATMYEVASQIVNMEYVLNFAALIAASVLLFIIMVGVLNSLRMTIRERTQEIGTMRAVGMKSSQIRKLIILETLMLSLASWVVGIIFAFIVMKSLRLIQFGVDNSLNMVMVDRRLYFIPTWWHFVQNLFLLLVFTMVTAYFPARQASRLKPAQAFRHISE